MKYISSTFLRFTEALKPLEEGLALVNKLGDDLASYRWPGSQVIIDETKPGKLQASASVASHAGVRHVFLLHFEEDCVTSQRTSAWEASVSVDTLIPKCQMVMICEGQSLRSQVAGYLQSLGRGLNN